MVVIFLGVPSIAIMSEKYGGSWLGWDSGGMTIFRVLTRVP